MSKATMVLLLVSLYFLLTQCEVLSGYQPISFSHNLQFRNKTGGGVTAQQMQTFIAIANYASSVYGDDIQKNIKYIKLRMDSLYGTARYNFVVFIQTDQDVMTWRVFVMMDAVYAAVEGINKLYPKWSYLFNRFVGSNIIPEYAYFHQGVGTGFTQSLLKTLEILILENESGDECVCDGKQMYAIFYGLYLETSDPWNIVCDNLGTTYSLIHSQYDQWIVTKPKYCYYTIYT